MSGLLTERPWGSLQRVLAKTKARRWSVLGCVGPEQRALTAVEELEPSADLIELVRVVDPQSRYTPDIALAIEQHRGFLSRVPASVRPVPLLATAEELVEVADGFVERAGLSLAIDITCFPKRHFFAIVKRLLASGARDLLATYTFAAAYAPQALAEDPEPPLHLPLFAPRFPEPTVEAVIVGLGFQPLGIPEILEDASAADVTLLFPYPGQPDEIGRIWSFVRAIQDSIPRAMRNRSPLFVPRADVPEIFDHLRKLTDEGNRYAVLAPFGPKPMSLAMCIFASLSDMPVYYTQPMVYNPGYSVGVSRDGGLPVVMAYWLRIDGRDLYAL